MIRKQCTNSVLVLRKASDGKFQTSIPKSPEKPETYRLDYIALEYFDSFSFYQDAADYDPLEITSHPGRSTVTEHPYPIYTSDTSDDRKDKVTTFVNNTSLPFFYVTMIHLKSPLDSVDSALLNRTETNIHAFLSNQIGKDLLVLPFRSLELSNLVILWRNASIETAIASLDLMKLDETMSSIGHTHTICGITQNKATISALETENSIKFPMVDIHIVHRNQFAIADLYNKMRVNLSATKSLPLSTSSGVYDSIFRFENVPAYQYMKMLLSIEYNKNDSIGEALENSAISISTHCYGQTTTFSNDPQADTGRPDYMENSAAHKALSGLCNNVSDMFQQLIHYNRVNQEYLLDRKTVEIISELLIHLVRMSENNVLDDVCCYLLRPVRRFIRKLCDRTKPFNSQEQDRIYSFVRNWQMIVEQTVKVDGTYNHDPYFSLRTIDIPAKLLEFYTAFAWKATILTNSEHIVQPGQAYDSLPILMVPRLCRRVKIKKPIPFPDSHDRLLLVEVPIHRIADLQGMLLTITHEILHFSGEIIRCRKERELCLTEAMVILAVYLLKQDSPCIREWLFDYLAFSEPESKKKYLPQQLHTLANKILELIRNSKLLYELFDHYYDAQILHISNKDRAAALRNRENAKNDWFFAAVPLLDKFALFADDLINTIGEVVREGYADLVMIKMLNLTPEEYLHNFEQEFFVMRHDTRLANAENESDESKDEDKKDVEYSTADFAQRAASALFAAYDKATIEKSLCNIEIKVRPVKPYSMGTFIPQVKHCIHRLSVPNASTWEHYYRNHSPEERENNNLFLNAELYQKLQEYLNICAVELDKHFSQSKYNTGLKQLRELYRTVGQEGRLVSKEFYELLFEYRTDLIKQ